MNYLIILSVLIGFRYKYSVLVLTFITYAAYHASRKPISVVKIVLYQNCSEVTTPAPINNTDRSF